MAETEFRVASRPAPIESPALAAAAVDGPIRHGFFTRAGGISQDLYAGLNVGLGSDDARERVEENRARVAAWFGADVSRLATLHQVHSTDVVTVDAPLGTARPKADAMVTDRPGVVLGVLTADCGPILFADPGAGVIGAAHAGWRGAFEGIAEATVAAMERLGAKRERIIASLGPSISARNYEVGPEFVARFLARSPDHDTYFSPSARPDHAMFDLPRFTVDGLAELGIRAESLDLCTYADEERFFSYRRATHRGEPDYGRQISAISIGEH